MTSSSLTRKAGVRNYFNASKKKNEKKHGVFAFDSSRHLWGRPKSAREDAKIGQFSSYQQGEMYSSAVPTSGTGR